MPDIDSINYNGSHLFTGITISRIIFIFHHHLNLFSLGCSLKEKRIRKRKILVNSSMLICLNGLFKCPIYYHVRKRERERKQSNIDLNMLRMTSKSKKILTWWIINLHHYNVLNTNNYSCKCFLIRGKY